MFCRLDSEKLDKLVIDLMEGHIMTGWPVSVYATPQAWTILDLGSGDPIECDEFPVKSRKF